MDKNIFVALSTFAEFGDDPLQLLQKSPFPIKLNPLQRRLQKQEIIEMGKESIGIIAGVEPYDHEVLEQLTHLRCLSRCGVGIDNINLETTKQLGITVRNTPNVVIAPVAELTIAMIFDLLKKLTYHTTLLKARQWKKSAGNMLTDKHVGIIGLGQIGKRVAELLLNLGARVSGCDIHPDTDWCKKFGIPNIPIDQLLNTVDIVSLHLTTNADSPFKLDAQNIQTLKPGAFVINVSRGNFIDDLALYEALKVGHLSGAALDVFPDEPYTGPLCDLDNVILTPHLATLTRESRVEMELLAAKNLLQALSS